MPLIYFYSHDGEGLGHFRRNLNIAQAVCSAIDDTSALLLTGSLYPGLFHLPQHCDYVKIPALQKSGVQRYNSQLGVALNDVSVRIRKDLIRSVVKSTPPDILVVDKHAAGLNGELLPALSWLRHNSPATKIILGLRDVLDAPEQVRREWQKEGTAEIIDQYYDRVWIYGDSHVYDTVAAYPFASGFEKITTSTGYLTQRIHPGPVEAGTSYSIVVTAGGGHDGFPVFESAVRALEGLRAKYSRVKMRLFTGPLISDEEYHCLKRNARRFAGSVRIDRFSQRLQKYIMNADAVITMGGYNSIVECISTGKPTIVIPREHPRKEQLIRAQAFEACGFVRVVRQAELSGPALLNNLEMVFSGQWLPASADQLDFSGLDRVVTEIRQLLDTREAPNVSYAD